MTRVIEAGSPPSRASQTRTQTHVFQSLTISAVRALVSRRAAAAGMDVGRAHDLVLAVCEVATNSVRHADGSGVLRIWQEGDGLVCEVADRGRPARPLAGRDRPMPGQEGGYGLWIAGQLCDRIQLLQRDTGTVIRMHMAVKAG